MTETTIGARIKAARERERWSQSKLAEKAGVQSSTISQIESGYRKKPSIDVLQKIANALSTTVSQLIGQTTEIDIQDLLQNSEIQIFFRDFKDLPKDDKERIKQYIEFLKSRE